MKCPSCGFGPLKSSRIQHKYIECGLDNVMLHGVERLACAQCGEELLSFGDMGQLHRMIAGFLIRKQELLTGAEIRFLRKYLGYSSGMFAQLVGYSHEHLSRIEHEKVLMPEVFDRLVRTLVAEQKPDRDYRLHDIILEGKAEKNIWLELILKDGGWTKQAA